MEHLQISNDNTVDVITHKPSEAQAHVSRKFCQPFLLWCRNMHSYFTVIELIRLHRRFEHHTAEQLHNFLRGARPDEVSTSTVSDLHKMARTCSSCQLKTPRPHRFKFSFPDEKQFNHSIFVDITTLEKKRFCTSLMMQPDIRPHVGCPWWVSWTYGIHYIWHGLAAILAFLTLWSQVLLTPSHPTHSRQIQNSFRSKQKQSWWKLQIKWVLNKGTTNQCVVFIK